MRECFKMANCVLVMSAESRCSLLSFLGGAAVCSLPLLSHFGAAAHSVWDGYWQPVILGYAILQNAVLLGVYPPSQKLYQIALRGGFLGLVFGLGVLTSVSGRTFAPFGWYITALSFFHWSEFFVTAVSNPRTLSLDSYLLDHSREYKLAAVGSWLEFWLEWYLVPGLKSVWAVSLLGLVLVLGGEVFRKTSMLTARTNFNHYVQRYKQEGHQLVTRGVYSVVRHPAYFGWFYWSLGTQLILVNPVCFVAYTLASWRFFKERIQEEEIYLLNFFGEDYVAYQRRTCTGLPFIKGYRGQL